MSVAIKVLASAALLLGGYQSDAGQASAFGQANTAVTAAVVANNPNEPAEIAADTAAGVALDSNMPYQATRSNPVTYDVDLSAVVTPPYGAKLLRVWMPLPQTDVAQEVTELELSSFPMEVAPKIGTEKKYGNKFAYFEFKEPKGAQIIRHKFRVKAYELNWDVKPEAIRVVKDWPSSFESYLKGESQAVVTDDRFSNLLNQIVPQPGNPLNDLSSVMDWMIKGFRYDHNNASLHASSVWALENNAGHCSDYHGFCSAMGRLLNSPTRVTYGINPFPKNSPSHCKMEAYLPPYGWVSFDVSETQNLLGLIAKASDLDDAEKQRLSQVAKERLVRGFRDNTWFKQTQGTDYDLEPPAAKRAAVVRTIYVEADGVEIPDCDSASKDTKAYTWMTVHKYVPDRPVTYTFKDIKSLSAAK
jgi:transglutaminase-like putative cysteine protease